MFELLIRLSNCVIRFFLNNLSNRFYDFFRCFANKFCYFCVFSFNRVFLFKTIFKKNKFCDNEFDYCENFINAIIEQQYQIF